MFCDPALLPPCTSLPTKELLIALRSACIAWLSYLAWMPAWRASLETLTIWVRLSAFSSMSAAIVRRMRQAASAVPPSSPRSEETSRLMSATSANSSVTEENKSRACSIELVRHSSIP